MLPGQPSLLSGGGGDAIAQRRNLSLLLGLAFFFFFFSKHSLPILILMSRFDSNDEKLK